MAGYEALSGRPVLIIPVKKLMFGYPVARPLISARAEHELPHKIAGPSNAWMVSVEDGSIGPTPGSDADSLPLGLGSSSAARQR
jgi:hypothetical protein